MMSIKKTNVTQRQSDCEAALRRFAKMDLTQLFAMMETSASGLSALRAEEELNEHGKNIIRTKGEHGMWHRLVSSFINPFNLVLFAVAVVTFITDVVVSDSSDYTTSVIIVVLIIISSAISFIQGERSSAAAAALSKMISNKVDVFRDNTSIEINMDEVVPGDVVKLSAGDMIPGDVRFLSAKDAFVAQSALTGESQPAEKFVENKNSDASLTDITNIGFMGSNIVSGSAEALVLTTGNDTYVGSMAKHLSGDRAKNSFERGVESVSRLLLRFMLVLVPVIFIVNGLTKHDWAQSFLFAVTMAVGLTPEMLPMIMTSTLAKGAVSLSKHEVIVKTLSAIQTFGEMDVLCTDKTGTLTQDKIVLERYLDVFGKDDTRVLRHGFLNSYFQTGLKNLIDLAIINRAKENGLSDLLNKYHRVDEIPFDFSRRRMSVVLVDDTGKRQLITKGAPEEILSICSYADLGDKVVSLDKDTLALAQKVIDENNADGLRMVAVAQKNNVAGVNVFGVGDESEMVLLGFICFLDPPKESAKQAVETLKSQGVRTVVLTGDSEGVAAKVCARVSVRVDKILNGAQVEAMDDDALREAIKDCDVFAKLSPVQKKRVVETFQKNGHTVGYMGDGINDALALRQADVGISVDSGVDIAKETADIILLKKDLLVLSEGVSEGRRIFGNIMKYLKMAVSGNFGNMFSVLVASAFLPFLPMLPVHILTQNLLCDFSQLGIPFDVVDQEYLAKPRKWETASIQRFMLLMGPLSSLFDVGCFAVLWWVIKANTVGQAPLFQAGWFVFGTLSQILVVHMIRTQKVPFIQSRAAWPLELSSLLVALGALVLVFTPFTMGLDFAVLPLSYLPWLLALLIGYCLFTQVIKGWYVKKFGEWL
jgi:Mg2+-importing ATPase